MPGLTSASVDHLTRSEIWSTQLKDILLDTLAAEKYVRWLTGFTDGNQLTIPSIGSLDAQDYVEDQAVQYTALDMGEFNFTINQYKSAATYITNKAKQDMFYMSELVSQFVPKMSRAIKEDLELNILREGQPRTGNPAGYQVAGSANQINGADHRWVAQGTSNSNPALSVNDFAKAAYALDKANVPQAGRIALVDPSTAYVLSTLTNITNISNNPTFQGIINTGISDGSHFIRNIFGFDVWTTNYLPLSGPDQNGASETINSVASGANAVANLFFSAAPDVIPFVGAWRQMPKVDSEYNKDFQRDEFVTTCRYGLKIYRPENLVTVLSSRSVV